MRASLSLALTALFSSAALGFSSSTTTHNRRHLQPARLSRSDGPNATIRRLSPTGTTTTKFAAAVKKDTKTSGYDSLRPLIAMRGGAASPSTSEEDGMAMPQGAGAVLASFWGTAGVLYILGKAIKRVIPIALEPFQDGAVPLSQWQLGAYIVTCLWFAYVEGYKGFQTKFSPLVVKRSFTLQPGKNGTCWYHFLLAPLYSMALMHATKKRKIVSWSVTMGVALIVAAVKRAPYPYRNIVDAGVVAGLTWGSLSILILYLKSFITGTPPSIDAALPEGAKRD